MGGLRQGVNYVVRSLAASRSSATSKSMTARAHAQARDALASGFSRAAARCGRIRGGGAPRGRARRPPAAGLLHRLQRSVGEPAARAQVRPELRKILKWSTLSGLTLPLYRYVGQWPLALPSTLGLLGATFHLVWRRCNGIDPLKATPSRRYSAIGSGRGQRRTLHARNRTYRTVTGTSARTACVPTEPPMDASRANRTTYVPGVDVTIPITL